MAPIGAGPVPMPGEVFEEEKEAGWELLTAIDVITPQPARLRLRSARPSSCLDDYALQHDAPLLVVGAPAHGALASLLLGSTAWQLSRHARTPVMYVPEEPATWWRTRR